MLDARKSVYALLLLLRLCCALAPGYLHPDEFFQSPEISAQSVLNVHGFVPWEYQPDQPCRSIVIPGLATGLPFFLLKCLQTVLEWLGYAVTVITPVSVYATTRVSAFLYSMLVDLAVHRICRLNGQDPWRPLLVAASSHALLVYHTRSFSNAIESELLGLSLWAFFRLVKSGLGKRTGRKHTRVAPFRVSIALGGLLALGLFSRITSVLFSLPIVLAFCYVADRRFHHGHNVGVMGRVGNLLTEAMPVLFGVASVTTVCLIADSLYFGQLQLMLFNEPLHPRDLFSLLLSPQLWGGFSFRGSLVVTPWNNAMYNVDADNLSQHGLHPRYLHLLLNMPLLFGPLALLGYWTGIRKLANRRLTSRVYYRTVTAYVVICGVAALSIMPHQEARFLLPVLTPLVVTLAPQLEARSKLFWASSIRYSAYTSTCDAYTGDCMIQAVWIVFNAVCAFVFGVVHQSGVLPAIDHVYRDSMVGECKPWGVDGLACTRGTISFEADGTLRKTNVIFYKTYMPPLHLFLQPADADASINVTDLAGAPLPQLAEQLQIGTPVHAASLEAVDGSMFARHKDGSFERTLLVTPAYVDLSSLPVRLARLHAIFPHVNYDDLDKLLASPTTTTASLAIYQLVA
ncbi:Alg9-like mannosyltransferase family-domain-containing protein [Thamnocephalis sphaerospora]|uniref:Mannosyltransferase n=1 Tax=Thamnocephalis sphaerospora TaxID=78915 RepID=A0A4P9XV19_9FUNG|nr:Alg9-like mannosyltransferase family-domain-containing protein [Thamnocephalis sphaerospora]|eukprot:RKP10088.1 Alg9-like mannosyltransferase family-domain-containing protein [Thamnocephalis sphaerospora]